MEISCQFNQIYLAFSSCIFKKHIIHHVGKSNNLIYKAFFLSFVKWWALAWLQFHFTGCEQKIIRFLSFNIIYIEYTLFCQCKTCKWRVSLEVGTYSPKANKSCVAAFGQRASLLPFLNLHNECRVKLAIMVASSKSSSFIHLRVNLGMS